VELVKPVDEDRAKGGGGAEPSQDNCLAKVIRTAPVENKTTSGLVLELHDVRVSVGRGVDRETLTMVLGAVDALRPRR
jgi:hypothetical protein